MTNRTNLSYNIAMIKNYNETTAYKIRTLSREREQASEKEKPKYTLAINLLELRNAAQKSQTEAAQALGVNQRNITRWETAESTPSLWHLIAFARYYETTVDRLITP